MFNLFFRSQYIYVVYDAKYACFFSLLRGQGVEWKLNNFVLFGIIQF